MVKLCVSSFKYSLRFPKKGTSAQAKESCVIMESKPSQNLRLARAYKQLALYFWFELCNARDSMSSLPGILYVISPLKKIVTLEIVQNTALEPLLNSQFYLINIRRMPSLCQALKD